MSSTNVHSGEQKNNIYCAGAQMIATEKEVEIPPKNAKKGPSMMDVLFGESMEIVAGDAQLKKDGKLVAEDGTQIATFDEKSFNIISKNNENRKNTSKKSKRGNDRGE